MVPRENGWPVLTTLIDLKVLLFRENQAIFSRERLTVRILFPPAASPSLKVNFHRRRRVGLIGAQFSFGILVNFRLAATNYTDDLLGESAESGQETHFQFRA